MVISTLVAQCQVSASGPCTVSEPYIMDVSSNMHRSEHKLVVSELRKLFGSGTGVLKSYAFLMLLCANRDVQDKRHKHTNTDR